MKTALKDKNEMAKVVTLRDGIAARIRELSERWAENTFALGREFKRARDSFPIKGSNNRPGWYAWIAQETEWHRTYVSGFINVYEKFGESTVLAGLSFRAANYLAKSVVPIKDIEKAIKRERLEKPGKKINAAKAKEIIKPFLPTRSQAIKQARETGKLTPARDGKIYSGASEDEMAAYSERRCIVYNMRDAVDAIANCEFTPQQWIKACEAHWISEFRLAHLDAAIEFLTKLQPLLAEKQKVIANDG